MEGARVPAVIEILPYSSGLPRNIQQCLRDYDIPLYLKHTVVNIGGSGRVDAVTIAEVDDNRNPMEGTEKVIECDTLLLSVGLVPENDLSREASVELNQVTGGPVVDEDLETTVEGVFACGNVLQVHDIVDYVTLEAVKARKSAAEYVPGKKGGVGGEDAWGGGRRRGEIRSTPLYQWGRGCCILPQGETAGEKRDYPGKG